MWSVAVLQYMLNWLKARNHALLNLRQDPVNAVIMLFRQKSSEIFEFPHIVHYLVVALSFDFLIVLIIFANRGISQVHELIT